MESADTADVVQTAAGLTTTAVQVAGRHGDAADVDIGFAAPCAGRINAEQADRERIAGEVDVGDSQVDLGAVRFLRFPDLDPLGGRSLDVRQGDVDFLQLAVLDAFGLAVVDTVEEHQVAAERIVRDRDVHGAAGQVGIARNAEVIGVMRTVGDRDVPRGIVVTFFRGVPVADDHFLVRRGVALAGDGREPGQRAAVDSGVEVAVAELLISGAVVIVTRDEAAGGDAGDIDADRGAGEEVVERAGFAAVREERAAADRITGSVDVPVGQVVAVDLRGGHAVNHDGFAVHAGVGIRIEERSIAAFGDLDGAGGLVVVRHQHVGVVLRADLGAADSDGFACDHDRLVLLDEVGDSVGRIQDGACAGSVTGEVDDEFAARFTVADVIGHGDVLAGAEAEVLDSVDAGELGVLVRDHAVADRGAFDAREGADGGRGGGSGDADGGAVIAVGAVADDEAADRAAVELDVDLAEAGHIIDAVVHAAEDVDRVVAGGAGEDDLFAEARERVHAVDQEVAVVGRAVDGFREVRADVDVARIFGDQPQAVLAVEVELVFAVDRDDAGEVRDVREAGSLQDDLARAVVFGGGEVDGADVERAVDGQRVVAVDIEAAHGDVAAHRGGALDDHLVELADVAVDVDVRGNGQGAGAADGFLGADEIAAGVAGERDGLPFGGSLAGFRIGHGDFLILLVFIGEAVVAAEELEAGIAGDGLAIFGHDDAREASAGDAEVHERGRVLIGEGAVDRLELFSAAEGAAGDVERIARGESLLGIFEAEEVAVAFFFAVGVAEDLDHFRIVRVEDGLDEDFAVRTGLTDNHVVADVVRIVEQVRDVAVPDDHGLRAGDERVLVGILLQVQEEVLGAGFDVLEAGFEVDQDLAAAGVAGRVDVDDTGGVDRFFADLVGARTEGDRAAGEDGIDAHVHGLEPVRPLDVVGGTEDVQGGGSLVGRGALCAAAQVGGSQHRVDVRVFDREGDRHVPVVAAFVAFVEDTDAHVVAAGAFTNRGVLDREVDVIKGAPVGNVGDGDPLVAAGRGDIVPRHVDEAVEFFVFRRTGVAEQRLDVAAEFPVRQIDSDTALDGVPLTDEPQAVVVAAVGEVDRDRSIVDQRVGNAVPAVGTAEDVVHIAGDPGAVDIDRDRLVDLGAETVVGVDDVELIDRAAGDVQADRIGFLVVVHVAAVVADIQRAAGNDVVHGLGEVAERVGAPLQHVAVGHRGAGDGFREGRIEVDAGEVHQVHVLAGSVDGETRIAGVGSNAGDAAFGADDLVEVAFVGLDSAAGHVDRAAGHIDVTCGEEARSLERDLLHVFDAADRGLAAADGERGVARACHDAVNGDVVAEGDRGLGDSVGAVARGHGDAADLAGFDRDVHAGEVIVEGAVDEAFDNAALHDKVRAVQRDVFGDGAAGDGHDVLGAAEVGDSIGRRAERVEAVLEIRAVRQDGAGGGGRILGVQVGVGLDRGRDDEVLVREHCAVLFGIGADELDVREAAVDAVFGGDDGMSLAHVLGDVDRDGGVGEVQAVSRDHGVREQADVGAADVAEFDIRALVDADGLEVRHISELGVAVDIHGGETGTVGAGERCIRGDLEFGFLPGAHRDFADHAAAEFNVVAVEVLRLEGAAGDDDRSAPFVGVRESAFEVVVGVGVEVEFLAVGGGGTGDGLGVRRVHVHVVGLVEDRDAVEVVEAVALIGVHAVNELALAGHVIVADNRDVAHRGVGVDEPGRDDRARAARVSGHIDVDLDQLAAIVEIGGGGLVGVDVFKAVVDLQGGVGVDDDGIPFHDPVSARDSGLLGRDDVQRGRDVEGLQGVGAVRDGVAGAELVGHRGAADFDVDAAGDEGRLVDVGRGVDPVGGADAVERAANHRVVNADVDVRVDRRRRGTADVDAAELAGAGIVDRDVDVDRIEVRRAEVAVADVGRAERAAFDHGGDVAVHHAVVAVAGHEQAGAGRDGVLRDERVVAGHGVLAAQAVDVASAGRTDDHRGVILVADINSAVADADEGAGLAVVAAGGIDFEQRGNAVFADLVADHVVNEDEDAIVVLGGRNRVSSGAERVHAVEERVARRRVEGIAVDEVRGEGAFNIRVEGRNVIGVVLRDNEEVARVRRSGFAFAGENERAVGGFAEDRDLGDVERDLGGIDVEDQAGAGARGGVDDDRESFRNRVEDGEERARLDREFGGGDDALDRAVAGDGDALRGDVADDGAVDHDVERGGVDVHAGGIAGDDDLRAGLGGRDGVRDGGKRILAERELVAVDVAVGIGGESAVDEELIGGVDHHGGLGLDILVVAGIHARELDRPGVHAAFGAHDLVDADQIAAVDGDGLRAGGGEVAGNDEVRGIAHRDAAAEGQTVENFGIGLVREADFRAGIDGDVAGDFGAAGHVHLGGRQVLDARQRARADEAGVDQVDVVQGQAALLREDAFAAAGRVEVDVAGVVERAADRDVADRGDLAGVDQVAADDHAGGQDHIVVVHVAGRRNADLVGRGDVAQRADRAVVVDVLGFDQAGVDGALVQDVAVDHERILVGEGGLAVAACNVQGTARDVQCGEVLDGSDLRVTFDVQRAGRALVAAVERSGDGRAVDQAVERGEHVVAEIGGVRRLAITEVRDRAALEGDFDRTGDGSVLGDVHIGELAAGEGQVDFADLVVRGADDQGFGAAGRDVGFDLADGVGDAVDGGLVAGIVDGSIADDQSAGVDGVVELERFTRGGIGGETGHIDADCGAAELDGSAVVFGVHGLDRVAGGQVVHGSARGAVDAADRGVLDRDVAGEAFLIGQLHFVDRAVGDADLSIGDVRAGHVERGNAELFFVLGRGVVDRDFRGAGDVAEADLINIIGIRGGEVRGSGVRGAVANDDVLAAEIDLVRFAAAEGGRKVLRDDGFGERARFDGIIIGIDHNGGRFLVADGCLRLGDRGVALRTKVRGLTVGVVAVDQQDRTRGVVDDQVAALDVVEAREDTLGVLDFGIADVEDQILVDAAFAEAGNDHGVGFGEFAGHIQDREVADGGETHVGADCDADLAAIERGEAGRTDGGARVDRDVVPVGDGSGLGRDLGRLDRQVELGFGLGSARAVAGDGTSGDAGEFKSLNTMDAIRGGGLAVVAVDRVVEREVPDRGTRHLDGGVGVDVVVFTGVVTGEVAEDGVRQSAGDGVGLIRGADETFVDEGAAAVGRSADVEVDVALDPADSVPAGAAEAGAHVQAGEPGVGRLEIDVAGSGVLAVSDLGVGRDVREHQEHVGEGRSVDREINVDFTLEVGAVNTGLDDAELALEQGVLDVGTEICLFSAVVTGVNAAGEDDTVVGDGAAVDEEVDVAVKGTETDVAGAAFTHAVAGTVGDAEPLRHRLLEGEFVVAGERLRGVGLAAEAHQVAAERGTFDVDVQRAVGIGGILVSGTRRSGVVAAERIDDVGVIEQLAAVVAEEVIVAAASRGAAIEIRDENRVAVFGLNCGRVVVVCREVDEGVFTKRQSLAGNGAGGRRSLLRRIRRIDIDVASRSEFDENVRFT